MRVTMTWQLPRKYFQIGLATVGCLCLLWYPLFWSRGFHSAVEVAAVEGGVKPQAQSGGRRLSSETPRGGFYQLEGREIYIYSAMWDHRFDRKVRLFGMQKNGTENRFYCNFYFESGARTQVPMHRAEAIYPDWPSHKLKYLAYYYECKVPLPMYSYEDVRQFSIVASGLSRETFLPLGQLGLKEDRQDLAVCVKGIWGSVDARRLVEWIEFNLLLGVRKIVFYDTTTVGEATHVLEHYAKAGIADIIPFDYALHMSSLMQDDPMRRQLRNDGMLLEQTYLISINDCLYRYRDDFKYIAVIDVDEIIIPSSPEDLPDVIDRALIKHSKAAAFAFSTAWHFGSFGKLSANNSVPSHLHMQNHLYRTPVVQSQPKGIVITDRFYTVNWHSVIIMPVGLDGNVFLPWDVYGYVHHFREKCKYSAQKCQEMEQQKEADDVIPRYRHLVEERVTLVLSFLQLAPP